MKKRYARALALVLTLALLAGALALPAQAAQFTYDEALQYIIDNAVLEGMADWQKCLAIHDFLILHVGYDYSLKNHSPQEILLEGKGVCEAYAEVFKALMDRVGIPCVIVTGYVTTSSEPHAWNLVQIGGVWYHVDPTWDDVSWLSVGDPENLQGGVNHSYFLISDSKMSQDHYDWRKVHTCSDTSYDYTAPWEGADSQVIFADLENAYFRTATFNNFRVFHWNVKTGQTQVIYQVEDSLRWYQNYGLSLDGGRLYASNFDHVYMIPTDWSEARIIYTPQDEAIYGSYVRNGTMYLSLAGDDGDLHDVAVPLPEQLPDPTPIIPTVPPADPGNPFTDVLRGQYYYEPVLWAVEKGITNGTTATTFDPAGLCTRGQVVTFLWRVNGAPEPESSQNPFTDVASDAYYYKAVLWAVERGITEGTSATTFQPEKLCTRSQVVTFLWRERNQRPPMSDYNPFVDISKDQYYYTAVLWARENNITSGASASTFDPEGFCTRGQIATFLHRTYHYYSGVGIK